MTNATTNLGEITYTREWDAPRELVFACMTTPDHLTHFWGPVGVSTPVENITVDLRPGGAFEQCSVTTDRSRLNKDRDFFLTLNSQRVLRIQR